MLLWRLLISKIGLLLSALVSSMSQLPGEWQTKALESQDHRITEVIRLPMWTFTYLLRTANCPQVAVHWYLRPTAPFPQQVPGLRNRTAANHTEESWFGLPCAVYIRLDSVIGVLEELGSCY